MDTVWPSVRRSCHQNPYQSVLAPENPPTELEPPLHLGGKRLSALTEAGSVGLVEQEFGYK